MGKYLYKYVGSDYLENVFADNDNVTLKCSYPKDFNDPYELFLTVDFNESPDILAFYLDAVGDLPQLPTTCFSHSPAVVPMWAHYAQNLQGLCIQFDEELLSSFFPRSGFGDVDYQDTPETDLTEALKYAYGTAKPRHLHFLRRGIFQAAYYTKASYWSYEKERRMIVRESETRKSNELILIDVPKECITSLVCGPRASEETKSTVQEESDQIDCSFFELKIGRTTTTPFFVNSNGDSFIFNGADIESTDQVCETCGEPVFDSALQCPWCQIDETHMINAASRNPYRLLDHAGMLEDYIETARAIDEGES
jgi:DUF2971 family protein